MSKKAWRAAVCAAVVAGALGTAPAARANHHFMQITEVFLGTGGTQADGAMFVELTTLSSGQQFVSGNQMVFYNADGNVVENVPFTSNPSDASGTQAKILVATTEAESFFGVTADLEFDPAGISGAGGQVCFNSDSFDDIDCVSWGNYSGPQNEAGKPFNPTEGIPLGASARRDESGGQNKDAYEFADDNDNSRRDFFMSSPFPEGGGNPTETFARIQFTTSTNTVDESEPSMSFMISRSGDTSNIQAVTFQSRNGSATKGSDFTHGDEPVEFVASETTKNESLAINDDSIFEGDETVKLRLRNPTNGAVLGFAMNATLTIEDLSDDQATPKTRITKPDHGKTYARANLTKLKGTANDGPGEVVDVDVSLRRNMRNGSCQMFNGTTWDRAACGAFLYLNAEGTKEWALEIALLKKSVGTNIKSYTAVSISSDANHNTESVLRKGRNKNTFEVN